MVQFFKGDEIEKKYYESGRPIHEITSNQLSLFFEKAFETYRLGEVIFDTGRAPLANAIPRKIFREAFASIFNSFLLAGSFENYLEVFRNIFGPDVAVTFTVPDPGKLNVDIVATGLKIDVFQARTIENNTYSFEDVLDHEGDPIEFRTVKGFESQYELEKMLFEMVPAGIFTTISLTIGS